MPPSEVPNWARREPKWKELIAMVLDLEPGQTLTVMFDEIKTLLTVLAILYGIRLILRRIKHQSEPG